jgi:hypothetical protein
MSKKITKAQEAEMRAEHQANKQVRKKIYCRLFYFLLAVGNIAIIAFLSILNASPEYGHYALASVSGLSALYFTIKLISE